MSKPTFPLYTPTQTASEKPFHNDAASSMYLTYRKVVFKRHNYSFVKISPHVRVVTIFSYIWYQKSKGSLVFKARKEWTRHHAYFFLASPF